MIHPRQYWNSLKVWWKRQRTLVKVGIIVAAVIVFFIVSGKGNEGDTVIETAKRQDLVRTVSATGAVVSTTDLSLSFQQSNLVKAVNVAVGDKVVKGQILATLSNASEAAEVQSARGTLLAAQARYNKTLEGERAEAVRILEIAVENARRKLYSDDLVADPGSSNQTSTPPVISGSYSGTQTGYYRIYFGESTTGKFDYSGLERGKGDADDLPKALGTKGLRIVFANSGYSISDDWRVHIPNTSGANYVANLNNYNSAVAELENKKAQARSADLEAARADVISAEGAFAAAQANFEKTVIRAPSEGTVTKVDIKLGELAETFVPVITVQDVGNLYIEADVNESSISNIAIGQPVTITYDAFGKEMIFSSTVISVDLGATVTDGIVNYKIKTAVPNPEKIRSGMTANLSIQTASLPQVIVVPERVIREKEGTKTVEVLTDERRGTTKSRTVTTGLRGDGGLVEITSGLSEGERVVFSSQS